jgi:hypothetical protein
MVPKSVKNVLITVKLVILLQIVPCVTRIYLTKDLMNQQIVLVIKAIMMMAQIVSANSVTFYVRIARVLISMIAQSALTQLL